MAVTYLNTIPAETPHVSVEDGKATFSFSQTDFYDFGTAAGGTYTLIELMKYLTGDDDIDPVNYERFVLTGDGNGSIPQNLTYTLADAGADEVGKEFEFVINAVIGNSKTFIVTISTEAGGTADGSDTITIDDILSHCRLVWNGRQWNAVGVTVAHS